MQSGWWCFLQPTDKCGNRAWSFLSTWWNTCCWYQHKEGIPVCISDRLPSFGWAVALSGHMPYGCKVTINSVILWLSDHHFWFYFQFLAFRLTILRFFMVFLSLSSHTEHCDNVISTPASVSFRVLSNSLFANHLNIQCYIYNLSYWECYLMNQEWIKTSPLKCWKCFKIGDKCILLHSSQFTIIPAFGAV